jgi:hypothetical protein
VNLFDDLDSCPLQLHNTINKARKGGVLDQLKNVFAVIGIIAVILMATMAGFVGGIMGYRFSTPPPVVTSDDNEH